MKKKDYIAVWLTADGARQFLGLGNVATHSRWVAHAQFEGEILAGVWVTIDRIEEWKEGTRDNMLVWGVQPPLCLVRWDFIVSIQVMGSKPTEIGIKAAT